MNMFGEYFGSMLMQVSDEMEEANKANKRKIQEAVDKYWEASDILSSINETRF